MISRVAVVGCGSIGKRHMRNLLALGAQSVVGVEPNPERRQEAARELGIEILPNLAAAANVDPVTLVVVAVPNAYHRQILEEAVGFGAHVFMEKPLASSSEGLEAVLGTMAAKGLKGFLGSNWKFHPALMTMKRLLDEGRIGKVLAGRVACGQYLPDWHPWEDYRQMYSARLSLGGGVLLDSHELDYTTWLIGPVGRVACFAGRVSDLEIETEDLASLILEHRCGAVVQVQLDYLQRAYHRTYEFTGSEGTLRWSFAEAKVSLYEAGTKTWSEWPDPPSYDLNTMYLDQMRHIMEAVESDAAPVTSLTDGLAVLKLIEAAKSSSRAATFVEVQS